MKLELLFKILAVIFVAVAVFFFWQGNHDGLFVSAVLGAVSFFLSIRFQFSERKKKYLAERLEKEQNEQLIEE